MKILVLVEDYPNIEGGVALMYVHTRNVFYKRSGIDVEVLSFRAQYSYNIDGILVKSFEDYKKDNSEYDLLILHAANIKHHYVFLKRYHKRFKKLIFVYHGHEVLKINEVYSKPYPYVESSVIRSFLQNRYDDFKLFVWRRYLPKLFYKSRLIFVSNWMLEEFEKWTHITRDMFSNNYMITYNSVGRVFEEKCYNVNSEKKYDFVTIRSYLDGSKYAIDIVNELAKKTPNARFLVIGKGKFFEHYHIAQNIEWRDTTLNHEEIMEALDSAKYALMPTRTDAQGLMMCEMAAYGIPVITSDIPVCHEVFDGFSNVEFISNNALKSLEKYINIPPKCIKDDRYYCSTTVQKEVDLIKTFVEE